MTASGWFWERPLITWHTGQRGTLRPESTENRLVPEARRGKILVSQGPIGSTNQTGPGSLLAFACLSPGSCARYPTAVLVHVVLIQAVLIQAVLVVSQQFLWE